MSALEASVNHVLRLNLKVTYENENAKMVLSWNPGKRDMIHLLKQVWNQWHDEWTIHGIMSTFPKVWILKSSSFQLETDHGSSFVSDMIPTLDVALTICIWSINVFVHNMISHMFPSVEYA